MNIFQLNYPTRLQAWHDLRVALEDKDILTRCTEIDKFWQRVPLVNHYLHPDFIDEWPNPWELISDNTYCEFARGLGMIYTLVLLGIKDVAFVTAKDYNNEDVVLVLVENAKYILNYWPDMVLNNSLSEFTITKEIDITPIIKRIG